MRQARLLRALVAAAVATAAAAAAAPDGGAASGLLNTDSGLLYTDWATKLRDDLLHRSGYDIAVPPLSSTDLACYRP